MEGGQEVSEIQPNRTLWRGIFSFLFFERQQRSHLKHHIASYKENNTGKTTLLYVDTKIYMNKHIWKDMLKHVGLLSSSFLKRRYISLQKNECMNECMNNTKLCSNQHKHCST